MNKPIKKYGEIRDKYLETIINNPLSSHQDLYKHQLVYPQQSYQESYKPKVMLSLNPYTQPQQSSQELYKPKVKSQPQQSYYPKINNKLQLSLKKIKELTEKYDECQKKNKVYHDEQNKLKNLLDKIEDLDKKYKSTQHELKQSKEKSKKFKQTCQNCINKYNDLEKNNNTLQLLKRTNQNTINKISQNFKLCCQNRNKFQSEISTILKQLNKKITSIINNKNNIDNITLKYTQKLDKVNIDNSKCKQDLLKCQEKIKQIEHDKEFEINKYKQQLKDYEKTLKRLSFDPDSDEDKDEKERDYELERGYDLLRRKLAHGDKELKGIDEGSDEDTTDDSDFEEEPYGQEYATYEKKYGDIFKSK
jgi:uncharacterized coiled-coil DUF342 family protein